MSSKSLASRRVGGKLHLGGKYMERKFQFSSTNSMSMGRLYVTWLNSKPQPYGWSMLRPFCDPCAPPAPLNLPSPRIWGRVTTPWALVL